MKLPMLSRCALSACCAAMAACSQTTDLSRLQYTPTAKGAPHRAGGPQSYQVLYSFGAVPDGEYPNAGVINVGGTLYGTTFSGGAYSCVSGGCGTVFSVTTAGTEKVLHSFGINRRDGTYPSADLVDVGGKLYGTTYSGGAYRCAKYGCGTVFKISTNGMKKILYRFAGSDGADPAAGLIDVGGTLYGATNKGGAYSCSGAGCGAVFSITTEGAEKVLYSFGNGSDGTYPAADLINVGGTLYGTTELGGAYEAGTVFSITPGGTEKVLHSFGRGRDGANPSAALIDVGGRLYGTTVFGGAYACNGFPGCGTVFSITIGGTEKVLHSFGNGSDGETPFGALIDVGGTFYSTTSSGGAYSNGTVFSITKGGTEKVLYSFGKGRDGAGPVAGLVNMGGTLYGTTGSGGAYGYGTVFSITPAD
ncbi:MAG: hypothetical protein JO113_03985 [Candidatus Eremiobacteraeota bacterium]|nr:hypothetical protein [Candidatus Eremiobacteraeota bacterium]